MYCLPPITTTKWEGFYDENLPRSFRNMRTRIVRHLESESHQKKQCLLKKMRNEVGHEKGEGL